MATYVVATIKSWNVDNFYKTASSDSTNTWVIITDKKELTVERLVSLKPRYIFFPHWSWIIPKNIFDSFECVVFHMTDLPYGRGGSPLQNLIARGHASTKISALRVCDGIDTGAIYFKEDLSLEGTATEIFERFSNIVFSKMIPQIISTEPAPIEQVGEPTIFYRRMPDESSIADLKDVGEVYDYIRMLDGEGYPLAFLETKALRLEFSKARLEDGSITANVVITKK